MVENSSADAEEDNTLVIYIVMLIVVSTVLGVWAVNAVVRRMREEESTSLGMELVAHQRELLARDATAVRGERGS